MRIVLIETEMLKQHPFHNQIYDVRSLNLEQLSNISEVGILQPLIANGDYEILSGTRRWEAAKTYGLKVVPVLIVDIKKEDEPEFILDLNKSRRRLIIELAREIQYWFSILRRKAGRKTNANRNNPDTIYGRTKDIVAKIVNHSATYCDEINKFDLDNEVVKEYFGQVDKDDATLGTAIEAIKKRLRVIAPREDEESEFNFDVPVDDPGDDIVEKAEVVTLNPFKINWDKPFNVFNASCSHVKHLKKGSVNMIFTSPPYYRQRDYDGNPDQLGQEETPEEYITNVCELFDGLYPVLAEDGSFFLNMGDKRQDGLQLNVPQRVAQRLIESGWKLANTIIWHKPNPKASPGAKMQPSYEFLYQLVKSKDYYDFILSVPTQNTGISINRKPIDYDRPIDHFKSHCVSNGYKKVGDFLDEFVIRSSVANMNLFRKYGYDDIQHSAPSNIALPTYCVFRSTRANDVILDPFSGQGTLSYVGLHTGRLGISFELSKKVATVQEAMLNKVWEEIQNKNVVKKAA